jgi:phosphoribosylformimino-5-aminoimidazole carboxamide ribotide isomerase
LSLEIIPAIDLLDGRVVRLRQGRYDQVTHYDQLPAALATEFKAHVRSLHVVDLAGARSGQPPQAALIKSIVDAFGPGVQVGGGVRSLAAIEALLELGVSRVVMGTAALAEPALLGAAAERFPGQVIVAVDARNGYVASHGWQRTSKQQAVDLVGELSSLSLAGFLYTDIERDGTEVGPNVTATAKLSACTSLPVLASGGVGRLEHIRALARAPISGVILGRALHEGRFSLAEAVQAARDL